MPKECFSNKDIKLSYINEHYCYSRKVALFTNGLGIIKHIDSYNNDNSINIADAKSANEIRLSLKRKRKIIKGKMLCPNSKKKRINCNLNC